MIASGQLTGVILAAGRGTRAYPYTRRLPKGMLDICGRPLLHNSLELMSSRMGIRDVVIVVSDQGGPIRDHFGDGSALGLSIRYLLNTDVAAGPVRSLLVAEEALKTEFMVVILSDELYVGSNHEQFLEFDPDKHDMAVAAKEGGLLRDVRKGYNLQVAGSDVLGLEEKPLHARNRLLGCGTYLFRRQIFQRIRESFHNGGPETDNLTAFLQHCLDQGERMRWFPLSGGYINVNYQHDVNRARSLVRKGLVGERAQVSLILPFLEQDPRQFLDVLEQCVAEGGTSEIVVVLGKGESPLQDLEAWPVVRVVHAPRDAGGFGAMIRHVVPQCHGDIIVLMMADGTFEPADMRKLMAYIEEAEMVTGTRTTRELIEQGANMNPKARLAHLFLAKLLEILWFRFKARITDTGCIYRAFWRYAFDAVEGDLRSGQGDMLVEMTIEMVLRRYRVVEVPVNYCREVSEKSVQFRERRPLTFFRILSLILRKRFQSLFR
ncbi:MAG: NTP transferase domain-containing protein [Magnetococcus sp. WYHC-3]